MPGCGAPLQGLDMAAQRVGGRHAEDEIEPLGAAEIQDFGRAVMAVGTDQDPHAWPVPADGPHQPVLADGDKMPGAQFFPNARINIAENLLRFSKSGDEHDALVF